jgi:hypothetical protein
MPSALKRAPQPTLKLAGLFPCGVEPSNLATIVESNAAIKNVGCGSQPRLFIVEEQVAIDDHVFYPCLEALSDA